MLPPRLLSLFLFLFFALILTVACRKSYPRRRHEYEFRRRAFEERAPVDQSDYLYTYGGGKLYEDKESSVTAAAPSQHKKGKVGDVFKNRS